MDWDAARGCSRLHYTHAPRRGWVWPGWLGGEAGPGRQAGGLVALKGAR